MFKKDKFNRKERTLPEINTTALPDIIFMLLFFFMVVTVVKEPDQNSDIAIPLSHYADKKSKEINDLKIGMGIVDGELFYSINNNKLSALDDLKENLILMNEKNQLSYSQRVLLKIDEEILIHKVNALKSMLRDLEILNIHYVINHQA